MADPEMGHAIQNLEIAAGRRDGEFRGEHWQDAWVYKWIESASYVYEQTLVGTGHERLGPDPELAPAPPGVRGRGPVIYTMESTDLPEGVNFYGVRLPRDVERTARFEPDLLGGVTVLEAEALAYESGHGDGGGLYRELPSAPPKRFRLRLIPYYAWNNRGTPRMTVWIPLG